MYHRKWQKKLFLNSEWVGCPICMCDHSVVGVGYESLSKRVCSHRCPVHKCCMIQLICMLDARSLLVLSIKTRSNTLSQSTYLWSPFVFSYCCALDIDLAKAKTFYYTNQQITTYSPFTCEEMFPCIPQEFNAVFVIFYGCLHYTMWRQNFMIFNLNNLYFIFYSVWII